MTDCTLKIELADDYELAETLRAFVMYCGESVNGAWIQTKELFYDEIEVKMPHTVWGICVDSAARFLEKLDKYLKIKPNKKTLASQRLINAMRPFVSLSDGYISSKDHYWVMSNDINYSGESISTTSSVDVSFAEIASKWFNPIIHDIKRYGKVSSRAADDNFNNTDGAGIMELTDGRQYMYHSPIFDKFKAVLGDPHYILELGQNMPAVWDEDIMAYLAKNELDTDADFMQIKSLIVWESASKPLAMMACVAYKNDGFDVIRWASQFKPKIKRQKRGGK